MAHGYKQLFIHFKLGKMNVSCSSALVSFFVECFKWAKVVDSSGEDFMTLLYVMSIGNMLYSFPLLSFLFC